MIVAVGLLIFFYFCKKSLIFCNNKLDNYSGVSDVLGCKFKAVSHVFLLLAFR
jgi:hypothetical protein